MIIDNSLETLNKDIESETLSTISDLTQDILNNFNIYENISEQNIDKIKKYTTSLSQGLQAVNIIVDYNNYLKEPTEVEQDFTKDFDILLTLLMDINNQLVTF